MKDRFCVVCNVQLFGQKLKYCSNKCKQKDHYHRVKQQTNTYHSQTLRALKRKLELVEMFGGKCNKCGYDKNLSALHFHHIDSTQKSFKLGLRILSNKKMSDILDEVKKCELLCANCHAEKHNPELSKENVKKIANGAARSETARWKGVNSGKP
jgi:hypothetical protein